MGRSRQGSNEGADAQEEARSSAAEGSADTGNVGPGISPGAGVAGQGTTGRYLVLLGEDAVEAGIQTFTRAAGLRVTQRAAAEGGQVDLAALAAGETIVFETLGVAVIAAPPDQLQALRAVPAEESGILALEPERIVYAFEDVWPASPDIPLSFTSTRFRSAPVAQVAPRPVSWGGDYLRGLRDGVNYIADQVLATGGQATAVPARAGVALAEPPDESQLTWGLQVTRTAESRFTGRGIRVAVLDTGFDEGHPDFTGRRITTQSFVPGESAQDGHGHGTHCIGTACGPRQPGQLPRYGIAYEAEIYAGKVLSNAGRGTDAGILAGIQWAISNGCQVISMSLGAPTELGESFSRTFETAARRALRAGTLIIAAAGNESDRRVGRIAPVAHPANCPSIMAVAALDQQLQVAWFSCGGLNPSGGQVDIGGPGVRVHSSLPRPRLYGTSSGTSMATPHVAGLAALHAEANPGVVGGALGWLLLQSARRLELPTSDVGAGLVQAP